MDTIRHFIDIHPIISVIGALIVYAFMALWSAPRPPEREEVTSLEGNHVREWPE